MKCLTFQRLEGLYFTISEPKRRQKMTGPAKILVAAGMMGNCTKRLGSDANDAHAPGGASEPAG